MSNRVQSIAIYALAAALGLAVCLRIYDVSFLLGTSAFWQAPHADQMQALTGWHGFAHDAWRVPLFEVKTLRYPQGANIIFTDSIPLLALLAKPFAPLLPSGFHYFGLWFALCFVLQSVGAVALLREWGVRDWLGLAAGTLIALSMPAWLIRHNHMALCGHFLLLFGLVLYARTQKAASLRRVAAAWVGLAVASLLLHIYLLAMVMALLAAAVAQRAWNHRRQWRAEWPALLAIPLLAGCGVLGIALLSGHFRGEAVEDASKGYGIYSMNLLQPWYPQGTLHFPWPYPVFDATGGQYEGFNYLGAGALLLILAALAAAQRQWKPALRRNGFLLLALGLLTLFALSNRVYWGDTAVLKYRVPRVIEKPVELFRSSGRFFWPVGYALALGAVALLARERRQRRWLAVVLIAAPLAQWIDAAPARDYPAKDTRLIQPSLLPAAIWNPILAQQRLVRVFPGFFCGPVKNHRLSQELQLLAARSGVPISTVFMARQVEDCDAERERMETLLPGEGELVFYLPPVGWPEARRSFPGADACRVFPLGVVCSRRFGQKFVLPIPQEGVAESYFQPVSAPPLPGVEPDHPIVIDGITDLTPMFGAGWYPVEPDGAWMRGRRAELRFRAGAMEGGDLQFHFRSKAFLSPRHPRRSLTVLVNGVRAQTFAVDHWDSRDRVVKIPEGTAAADGILRIAFEIDPVSSPAADGVSGDTRELGIQLQRVWFTEDFAP
ncbi:MAG: hypothetical protein IT169_05505 [Bryobacterales bacterium]|nr:hypothetical protein [Bryobacterales bacterium]